MTAIVSTAREAAEQKSQRKVPEILNRYILSFSILKKTYNINLYVVLCFTNLESEFPNLRVSVKASKLHGGMMLNVEL